MCVLHLGNLQFRNLSEEEGNESVSATQVQLDLREKTKLAFLSSLRTITITISACHHCGGCQSKRSRQYQVGQLEKGHPVHLLIFSQQFGGVLDSWPRLQMKFHVAAQERSGSKLG